MSVRGVKGTGAGGAAAGRGGGGRVGGTNVGELENDEGDAAAKGDADNSERAAARGLVQRKAGLWAGWGEAEAGVGVAASGEAIQGSSAGACAGIRRWRAGVSTAVSACGGARGRR